MNPNMDRKILNTCEKVADQAEVTGIQRNYKSVDMNPVRCVFGSGSMYGNGLRMIRNGRLGAAGQWGPVSHFELVERAIGSCRYGPKALIDLPSASSASPAAKPSTLLKLTHEEAAEYLWGIQSRIRESFPEALLSAELKWGTDNIFLANSKGLTASHTRYFTGNRLSVTMPSPDGLLQTGCSVDTTMELPDPDALVETLSLPLTASRLHKGEVVGRKHVVLSPAAFSIMLQALRAGVSGRLLARGASPLAGMEGKKVISDKLTVRDMPCLDTGGSSTPFDSEGIPAFNKILFKDGEFVDFIHDLSSAAETGAESTGNSGRNIGEHSRPVCTNIVVDSSSESSANLLSETGTGILVTNILSAESGNAASGHFVFDCGRVHLFRHGEIYGYYDGCVLTGNVYDSLSRVTDVGKLQYRTNDDLLPFVSLEGVSVR
ncbi:hypothetical protein CSA37_11050 [Candidatus Fermentibacteria bacterium]|nr:MAG: hypothetical protein CSA37_11050 [Candidatus Fermentibacteria bacterium]